jgi:hypothetical protein
MLDAEAGGSVGWADLLGGSTWMVRRDKRFVHLWWTKWKSRREWPAGFHLEEEMEMKHPNFLALMLVIVIIKVKIIIRKR